MRKTFYHGTSTACGIGYMLMPPVVTSVLSEEGRKRNLDRVFFTEDPGSARIYAGRARARFGGEAVVYRVIPMGPIECLSDRAGTSVYMAEWAFVELI